MKISRTVLKLGLGISAILIITSCYACSKAEDPEKLINDAKEVAENILQSMMENDYDSYVGYFADYMRDKLPSEGVFAQKVTCIKEEYGEYKDNSLEYQRQEEEMTELYFYFKAEFTKNDEIIVNPSFRKLEDELKLLWFHIGTE